MKSYLMTAIAGVLLAGGAALAQAPSPDAAGPGRPDLKNVGDWVVRCFPIQSPSPCDLFQEEDSQANHQRVLAISLAYVPGMDRHALQISVPLDVAIQKGLIIQTDSYTSPVLRYRRCDRNGCYVEMPVDSSLVQGLSKSGPAGKINIFADNGKSYALNFSLKGFTAGYDDMVAQARAKAKPLAKSDDATPGATP